MTDAPFELPMSMIERISRALCIDDGCNPDHEGGGIDEGRFLWQNYKRTAEAVLRAMLEPTPGMLHDGYLSGGYGECAQVPEVWQFMIEAALEGK